MSSASSPRDETEQRLVPGDVSTTVALTTDGTGVDAGAPAADGGADHPSGVECAEAGSDPGGADHGHEACHAGDESDPVGPGGPGCRGEGACAPGDGIGIAV